MHRRSLFVPLFCAIAGCGHRDAPASGNSIALYNAGAEAFRAERFGEARDRWRLAAARGDREAASNLGFLLYYGYGGPADSAAGIAFWQQAMRQNDAEAHRHVAQAIFDGNRRLGTLPEAYSHAVAARLIAGRPGELAGGTIVRDADRVVEALEPQLTPAERDAALRVGTAWARTYPGP